MPTDHNIPKLIINKLTQAQYEQAVKNADELYLTPDSGGLPDQTGQSGKYLTTDGTTAIWGTVSVPTVNDSTITIQKNSTTVDSFTLNQSSNKTIDISVPTKTSDLQNDSGFTTNTGTVTSVRVQAGTGLTSSQSSAQTNTLDTTIGIDNGYKLPTTTEFNAKEDKPTILTDESTANMALEGNTIYKWTTAITSLSIASAEVSDNETLLYFTTGAGITFTDSSNIKWGGDGTAPALEINTRYCIAIKNGFAEFDTFGTTV